MTTVFHARADEDRQRATSREKKFIERIKTPTFAKAVLVTETM